MNARTPTPSTTNVSMRIDVRLTLAEVAAAAGVDEERLEELVGLGLLEPMQPEAREFPPTTIVRLKRMLRLHEDLEIDLAAAAIITELVERLDQMENELRRRSGF